MTPLDLFAKILDNACSNPVFPLDFDWSTYTSDSIAEWDSYHIETHCVAWDVIARKTDGVWEVKNYTTD